MNRMLTNSAFLTLQGMIALNKSKKKSRGRVTEGGGIETGSVRDRREAYLVQERRTGQKNEPEFEPAPRAKDVFVESRFWG
ncbi:MAG TPA: hypothetical protein PKE12_13120 [Kiritimatiellia bacterium]|nr:hypothetical protein [Kiritimatiellia bacterium]